MAPMPVSAGALVPSVDEQFFDLICNDVELVAAEFDAIVAAEWPTPPPGTPGCGGGGQPTGGTTRRAIDRGGRQPSRSRRPGVGGWARERSPPHRRNDTREREAGDRPNVNQRSRGACSPGPRVSSPSV